jgi:hypothetical protein
MSFLCLYLTVSTSVFLDNKSLRSH